MIKKRVTIIVFALLALCTAISTVAAISLYKQQSDALILHGMDRNWIFWYVLSGKTDDLKNNYINNISGAIITYDQVLVGDGRLEVLWGIKDIVVTHDIKIGKESSDILANLPARPLSSCQIGEKCKLHPSNKVGFPVIPNQSLHGSGPQ